MSQFNEETNYISTNPNRLLDKQYAHYRYVLDNSSKSSRKQGLITPESYFRALEDPHSLVLENSDGLLIPAINPIENVPGLNYNYFDREYPGKSFLFSAEGMDNASLGLLLKYFSENKITEKSLFFEHSECSKKNLQIIEIITEILDQQRAGYSISDFSEYSHEPAPEQLRQGSMILYSGQLRLKELSKDNFNGDLCESFDRGVAQGDISYDRKEGSELLSGKQLIENHLLLTDMWEVYRERLSEIAFNFPINLEDSFEEFVDMVTDDGTVISIAYQEGKVACFTYLLGNIEKASWLNLNSLQKFRNSDHALYYFPGIVAHKERAGKAIEVLNAIGRACKQGNINFDILFECTNHSAAYIPNIISKAAELSGYVDASTQQEEQIYYKVLDINN